MSGFAVADDDWDEPTAADSPANRVVQASIASPFPTGAASTVPPGCNPNNPHIPYPTPRAAELDVLDDAIIYAITTPTERMYALQVEDAIFKFMKTTDLRKEMHRDMNSFRRLVTYKVAERFRLWHEETFDQTGSSKVILLCKQSVSVIPKVFLLNMPSSRDELFGLSSAGLPYQLLNSNQDTSGSATNVNANANANARAPVVISKGEVKPKLLMKTKNNNNSGKTSTLKQSSSGDNLSEEEKRLSLESKEKAYLEARARIFAEEHGVSSLAESAQALSINDNHDNNTGNNNSTSSSGGGAPSRGVSKPKSPIAATSLNQTNANGNTASNISNSSGNNSNINGPNATTTTTTNNNNNNSNNSGNNRNNTRQPQVQGDFLDRYTLKHGNDKSKALLRNKDLEEYDPDFQRNSRYPSGSGVYQGPGSMPQGGMGYQPYNNQYHHQQQQLQQQQQQHYYQPREGYVNTSTRQQPLGQYSSDPNLYAQNPSQNPGLVNNSNSTSAANNSSNSNSNSGSSAGPTLSQARDILKNNGGHYKDEFPPLK